MTDPQAHRLEWTQHAACRHLPDPLHVFFAEHSGGEQNTAKAICTGCPVLLPCLIDALSHPDEYGTRGALTAAERWTIQRSKIDWQTTLATTPGTPAQQAATLHQTAHETLKEKRRKCSKPSPPSSDSSSPSSDSSPPSPAGAGSTPEPTAPKPKPDAPKPKQTKPKGTDHG